jgi:hypothetical protein
VDDDSERRRESVHIHTLARAQCVVNAVLPCAGGPGGRLARARDATAAVVATGTEGLEPADVAVELAVELALKLASALERIASAQGVAAVDLAERWFLD